ncbi:MAG: YceI family protein [Deltaproteobacteria bacterium]|nr:YceI family protein [Nannocystaceae bacterium]
MPSTWNIDPVHSHVGFGVRHLMVSKVRGRFEQWGGAFGFDEDDPSKTKLDITIEAASIETKDAQRDTHLRSADFLDAATHPQLHFVSTEVETVDDQNFNMKGNLTIRGVTHPVTLKVEYAGRSKDPWGGERAGFSATTSISRKEWGLVWNAALETGGVVVGDKVDLEIEVELIRAK